MAKQTMSFESWCADNGVDLSSIDDYERVKALRERYASESAPPGSKRTYSARTHVVALIVSDENGERISKRIRNVPTRGLADAREFLLSLFATSGDDGRPEVVSLETVEAAE